MKKTTQKSAPDTKPGRKSTPLPRLDVDPHAAREAERYENPIASREAIMQLLAEASAPLEFVQIAVALGISSDEDRLEALRRRLRAMERDAQVVRNRRGGYAPVARLDLIPGRVVGHADGFGFLVPDAGGDDFFLPAREMRRVLHGDRVLVRPNGVDRRGRPEGAIAEILERANSEIVGRYVEDAGIGVVIPDNRRIHQDVLIPPQEKGSARPGQIVVARILEQPDLHRQPIGRIQEVLGDYRAPGMEVDIAIRSHGLPHVWPAEVEALAAEVPEAVPAAAKRGRYDLRELPLVTIDGEDARDFDDAVYCEPQGRGWRLVVAIADVAHYVRPGDPLDQEAELRGNSVYFPDRAIPMLPEVLSNGLCSLKPEVDRLALICEMSVSSQGVVKSASFHEGLIRSAARLTYTQVSAALSGVSPLPEPQAPLLPALKNLQKLFELLLKQRGRRGAIDFETTETRVIYGLDGRISRIEPRERTIAHRIIEECMLAANVAAAEFLATAKVPAIYRVHGQPAAEKIEDLRGVLAELGLRLPGGPEPTPGDYNTLLAQVKERPDAEFVQTLLLRSLKLAVYQAKNGGHFGLAYQAYTHFTSPIRRYPDLLVHRAIKHCLKPRQRKGFPYNEADLERLAEQSSMTERRADEASRDALSWLKCEFMQGRVGEVFAGRITGVTGFGLFVTLNEVYVEGLVHVTALGDDYFHHDPVGHRLVGERGGQVFRLSMPLTVRLLRVDLDDRKLDFELVQANKSATPSQPARGRKRR